MKRFVDLADFEREEVIDLLALAQRLKNDPQPTVLAGKVLDAKGSDDLLTLRAANEIFGGDFLSRINMDLRETKGW